MAAEGIKSLADISLVAAYYHVRTRFVLMRTY
jgi:hypothetical protein